MPVARRLNVSAAVLLTTLCAARPGHATPPATSEVVATEDERAAGPVRAVNDTSTPADTTDADTTGANTTDSDTTGAYEIVNDTKVIERHEEHQQHAVPPPPMPLPSQRRFGDKRLRHDRGMLAAGSIFAAICGVGAGLSIWAFFDPRSRPSYHGSDSGDAVAAVTGLLSCTVGAVALAAVGAARLKKRRGR
jgi:hypothetical protein